MNFFNLIPNTVKGIFLFYLFVKVFDFITGIRKAKKNGEFKSSKMREGISLVINELFSLIFVIGFDIFLSLNYITVIACLSAYIYKDSKSVIENFYELGVKLDDKIYEGLEIFNKNKGDKNNGK